VKLENETDKLYRNVGKELPVPRVAKTVPVFSVVEKFCFLEVVVRPNLFPRILFVLMTNAEDNYCYLF
jgi:hypothetical protein